VLCYVIFVNFTFSPFLGLIVTTPAGIMSFRGMSNSHPKFMMKAASKHLNSAFAKFCPMQLRGPCKNVNRLKLLSAPPLLFGFPSSIQRSGLNSLASDPQSSGVLFTAQGQMMISVPRGMRWPARVVSRTATRIVIGTVGYSRSVSLHMPFRSGSFSRTPEKSNEEYDAVSAGNASRTSSRRRR